MDAIEHQQCPRGHGPLRDWEGKARCWTCGWPGERGKVTRTRDMSAGIVVGSGIIAWSIWLGFVSVVAVFVEEVLGWKHAYRGPEFWLKAVVIGVGFYFWSLVAALLERRFASKKQPDTQVSAARMPNAPRGAVLRPETGRADPTLPQEEDQMISEPLQRLSRIYAAIGAAQESDPAKLKARVIHTQDLHSVFQDFRAGLTDDELLNLAHMLIYNIAHLRDHVKQWAAHSGRDKSKVDELVQRSPDVQIMLDLSDNDKHGYPRRDAGYSHRSPRLVGINRVMRLQTRAEEGSSIAMTIGPGGQPRFRGDGTAKAVITGDVVDGDNKAIGDLHDIALSAVRAWEGLLAELGLPVCSPGTH